jgi:hypothetical protein
VLETVADASDARIAGIASLTAMIGTGPSAALLPTLESELFRSSSPSAISLVAPARSEGSRELTGQGEHKAAAALGRQDPQAELSFDWTTPCAERPTEPDEYRLVSALRVLGASPGVLHGVDRTIEYLDTLLRRSNSTSQAPAEPQPHPRRRRITARPLIIAAGGAAVLLCASLLLLPGEDSGQARERNGSATPSSESQAAPATRETLSSSTPEQQTAITGDDPAAAFGALVARRQTCLDAAVASCLAEVDQAGSGAMRADESSVLGQGQAAVIDPQGAVLVERVGGSAIISALLNEQPASFLLMKGEAGWRLREFFERSG